MATLNVGIVGTGMIAHGAHAEAFQAVKGVRVLAAADVDTKRLAAFAAKYGIPKTYTDYEKLAADPDLDIVSVAGPVFLHAPAAIAALQAGKHVLVEKPMALNAKQAQAMVDAAKKAGRKLQVYYRRRFGREAVMAQRLIDRGALGRVYYVRTLFLRWRGRPGFDRNMKAFGKWFTRKQLAGGGPLMDLGGYDLDLTMGLLGFPEVESVSGMTFREIDQERARREGADVEDLAVALIRLKGARAISLETSFAGHVDEPNNTWCWGSKAGLQLHPVTVFTSVRERKRAKEVDCSKVRTVTPVQQFVNAIRNDKPIAISSGEQGLTVTRIQDAIYRSAELGKEVRLT
jgi:predicted dehydrogenase